MPSAAFRHDRVVFAIGGGDEPAIGAGFSGGAPFPPHAIKQARSSDRTSSAYREKMPVPVHVLDG
jgi:hypothetical protein